MLDGFTCKRKSSYRERVIIISIRLIRFWLIHTLVMVVNGGVFGGLGTAANPIQILPAQLLRKR